MPDPISQLIFEVIVDDDNDDDDDDNNGDDDDDDGDANHSAVTMEG